MFFFYVESFIVRCIVRFQPQGRFSMDVWINYGSKSQLLHQIWPHCTYLETKAFAMAGDSASHCSLGPPALKKIASGWKFRIRPVESEETTKAEHFCKRCWIFCVWIPGCGNDPMAREIFGNMPWEMTGFWSQRFPKARRREQSAEAGVL